jgi:HTH-type transcriptional regulator / antitoxin HipB
MEYTPKKIGDIVKTARINLGLPKNFVAFEARTGRRFISDLEKGKKTCQLGKVLAVLEVLLVRIEIRAPEKR